MNKQGSKVPKKRGLDIRTGNIHTLHPAPGLDSSHSARTLMLPTPGKGAANLLPFHPPSKAYPMTQHLALSDETMDY